MTAIGLDVANLSLVQAAEAVRQGEVSAVALLEACLANLDAHEEAVNATIWVDREGAFAAARAADAEHAAGGPIGSLHGLPLAHKDMYYQVGRLSTCGSAIRKDFVPSYSATVIERLAAAGAYAFAGLNMAEFAQNGTGHNRHHGDCRNPWNLSYITGGSSSGSGAAVASRFTFAALGSDTGGSIRGPAAYCGTIGLKPTYGLVSRRGVFPLSTTLDHCGPLSWTVEDSAIALQIIAGYDPLDPASVDLSVPNFLDGLGQGVEGLRIGLPRHFFAEAPDVSVEVVSAIDRAAETLEKHGAMVEQITLPDYELFNACGRVIMYAEAFAIHEQDYQTRPLDFGLLTYMRMTLGAFITAVDLHQAMRLRRELSQAVNLQLKKYDALITASALAPAPAFADIVPNIPPNWPIQTMPFNVTGNPAMSIPTGFSASGLPLSMQIVGRAFDEGTVLRIGAAFEAATGLSARRPALAEG